MNSAILLSGGLDSIALAYWKSPDIAYTIDYGQSCAKAEIRSSAKICGELEIKHEIITIPCRELGSGDLINESPNKYAPASDWWPFRNQFLITIGAMKAIKEDIKVLLFGSVRSDSNHVDSSKRFFNDFNTVISKQEGNLSISTPAIDLSTSELIIKSNIDISILSWAHSCHVSNYACGRCRGCNKHREVMFELYDIILLIAIFNSLRIS